jgi:hypothetical protein
MFLPSGEFEPSDIASQMVQEAEADGSVARIERVQEWWLVIAGRDWLAESPRDAFRNIVAHPSTGPNAVRWEVVLTAFATDVFTATLHGRADGVDADLVKGEVDTPLRDALRSLVPGGRVVAFRR